MIVPNETLIWLLSALWLSKYLIIYWFFIVCIILFLFCQGTDVSVEKEKKGWYINVKIDLFVKELYNQSMTADFFLTLQKHFTQHTTALRKESDDEH